MDQPPPDGVRVTMRLLAMVAVVYFAVFLAVLIPLVGSPGFGSTRLYFILIPLLLPWIIGVAICVVRRTDPIRNWMVPLLMSLLVPALFLFYNAFMIASIVNFGNLEFLVFIILTDVLFLTWYSRTLVRLGPRRCPGCGRRALIPLLRLARQERRTANTRWCGSCRSMYWQDSRGSWHEERRQTWLDEAEGRGGAGVNSGGIGPGQAPEHAVSPRPTDRPHEPAEIGPGSRTPGAPAGAPKVGA